MKSFLGNFYRHLAIFSGHTGSDARNSKAIAVFKQKNTQKLLTTFRMVKTLLSIGVIIQL